MFNVKRQASKQKESYARPEIRFFDPGPEHAKTIHRDGWTIPDIQEKLFEESAIHISRVPEERRKNYAVDRAANVMNDKFYLTKSPEGIQVVVAGGPGKHSAYIPTFGSTEECSVRIANV